MALKVENIKACSFDHEISSRKIIFTSDLHLPGDRNDPRADFDKSKADKYIQFQRDVVGGDLHVVIGDFFEGWQFENIDDLLSANRDITDLILDSNVIFVRGNHDNKQLDDWTEKESRHVPLYTEWTSGRKKVIARHGHAADSSNSDDTAWFGRFVTKTVGWFETKGFQVDEWAAWMTNSKERTPSKVDDGVFNRQKFIYANFAKLLIERYNSDCVVLGHTHRASSEEDVKIEGRKRVLANTGTWCNTKYGEYTEDCFIEISGKDIKLNCVV